MADPQTRAVILTKAFVRAGEALGLTQQALASVVGLSPATVSRMAAGKYVLDPGSKHWELAALLVRLYRGLDAIMAGDETAVQAWLFNPNTDLRAVPATLITRIPGLNTVVSYVDASRARL